MVQKLTLEATQSPERFKVAFFTFLQIFQQPTEASEESEAKNQKLFKFDGFEATLRSKANVVNF